MSIPIFEKVPKQVALARLQLIGEAVTKLRLPPDAATAAGMMMACIALCHQIGVDDESIVAFVRDQGPVETAGRRARGKTNGGIIMP